ncbi:MAG: hypothetical protein M5U26_02385 [Planctomycetota bacterium]|nr:hypothetical protein [Planctomycetota bacterium]
MAKAASAPRKSRKEPVKCQVKTLTSEGKCVKRRFFDEEESAANYARELKVGDPAFTYVVAIYEKKDVLEPSRSYEV